MSFLNPTYLWSLLGILIPIAIHLWNRKKVLTVKVGSIKMLTESKPKRTSNIRPNEWWLLFLRILMITFFAFILAGPNFGSVKKNETLTYIIDPELLQLKSMEQLFDSLPPEAARVMVSGFPLVEDFYFEESKYYTPKYWQLAQEMEQLETDSIIVLTKGLVSGIHGMRPSTPKGINWVVLETDGNNRSPIEATFKKDSIELLYAASDRKSLAFTRSIISRNSEDIRFNTTNDSIQIDTKWIGVKPIKPLNVLIVANDSLTNEFKYLKAAYGAIGKYLDRPIGILRVSKVDTLELDDYATLVWLHDNKFKNYPIKSLVYRPDSLANHLIVDGNAKGTFYLTHSLDSENIITEHLSEKLLELLFLHEDLIQKVSKYDQRIVDAKELQTLKLNLKNSKKYANLHDLSIWIWLVLSILLVVERILSKYRRQ